MAKQLAFYFDASTCVACKACQVACQDKNGLSTPNRWRRVLMYTGGSWNPDPENPGIMLPNIFSYAISTACMHCDRPLCMSVCPAKAISKREDGVVLINPDLCIGCRYCEWACPYGAPVFNEEAGVMTKCTFCEDLLAQGGEPACVGACIMRCLDFGELDELRAKYGSLNTIEPWPEAKITRPAIVVKPHKHSQGSGKGTGRITNLPEEL